jgi:hypothetical protein
LTPTGDGEEGLARDVARLPLRLTGHGSGEALPCMERDTQFTLPATTTPIEMRVAIGRTQSLASKQLVRNRATA